MKFNSHFKLEYRLVSGFGINRGEIGGYVCSKSYAPDEIDEMLYFVNKYPAYKCINPYSPSNTTVYKSDIEDGRYYHIQTPKIWELHRRHDLEFEKMFQKRKGRKSKFTDWTHIDGQDYVIDSEYFDVKERKMRYSSGTYSDLKQVFGAIPRRDYKNRLVCDWTIYGRKLYLPTKQ